MRLVLKPTCGVVCWVCCVCLWFVLADPHTEHDHEHDHDKVGTNWQEFFLTEPTRTAVYHSVLATSLVGLAPVLCVGFIPSDQRYLRVFLGFTAGGLLGDAFLHLIPESLAMHTEHDSHTDHMATHQHSDHSHHSHHDHADHSGPSEIGLRVLIGFVAFLVMQKLLDEVSGDHGHSHSTSSSSEKHNTHTHDELLPQRGKLTVIALSMLADMSHNFTDGMTISACFLISTKLGITQTLAILLHEIPHEIGDYCLLIDNGVSRANAALIQVLTALGCIAGCLMAFVFEAVDYGTEWILPCTAGGFIYIATVQVLAPLVENKHGLWFSSLQIIALICGVGLMIAVGSLEEHMNDFEQLLFGGTDGSDTPPHSHSVDL